MSTQGVVVALVDFRSDSDRDDSLLVGLKDTIRCIKKQVPFDELIEKIKSQIPYLERMSLFDINMQYAQSEKLCKMIKENDLLPILKGFVDRSYDLILQREAMMMIRNASLFEKRFFLRLLKDFGLLDKIVSLLDNNTDEVVKNAALVTLQKAAVCNRSYITSLGCIPRLISMFEITKFNSAQLEEYLHLLSTLTKGEDVSVTSKTLPILLVLLDTEREKRLSNKLLSYMAWIMCNISLESNEGIECLMTYPTLVHKVVALLDESDEEILLPAVRVIGNCTSGTKEQTANIVGYDIFPKLVKLLEHENEITRRDVCWAISNVAADNGSKIMEYNILPLVMKQFYTETTRVKREMIWILTNIVDLEEQRYVNYMVQEGYIELLRNFMNDSCHLEVLQNWKTIMKSESSYIERMEKVGVFDKLNTLKMNDSYEETIEEINLLYQQWQHEKSDLK